MREVLTNPQSLVGSSHRTIYHEFFNAIEEHRIDISEQSLRDEALLFVNAGTDTVSDALSVGTLNVLDNPEVHAKLRDEILKAWPKLDEPPRYEELENLPYLVRTSLNLAAVTHWFCRSPESCHQRIPSLQSWRCPSYAPDRPRRRYPACGRIYPWWSTWSLASMWRQ